LAHVTDGETTEGRILSERLDAHGLGGDELDDGGVTRLDVLGGLLKSLTGTTIDLLEDFGELAGNVGSVAIQHGGIASVDLTGVVEDDDLGSEVFAAHSGIVLGVRGDVTTADILDRQVLYVETNVVTRSGLLESFVVHLDGLNFSGLLDGGEGDDHTGLEDTGLDTADGHCTNTTDLVDVLKGNAEGLLNRASRRSDVVESLEESGTLPPGHVGGLLEHVVTVPSGDGDEGNLLGVVTDLLDEVGNFILDFVEAVLREVDGLVVHLVDKDDELLDTKGVSEESVLTGLSVGGNTGFELTSG
jgi:hypothetical protein